MPLRLPKSLQTPYRRDALLVAIGLAIGAVVGRGCHSSGLQTSEDRPLEASPRSADHLIEHARTRLADRPDDLDALTDLAVGSYLKGPDSYADGINALEKARSLGSTDDRLFFYAGVMYDALGLPDYAVNEFSRYLRHHPRDYEALVRLANVLYREQKYDEARTLYRQALDQWPKDPTVWFNFAVVSTEKGEADEAAHALEQVKRIAGQLPEGGLYIEGEIARLKGAEDVAISDYQQELAEHPNYVPALEALETAQKQKGLTKEARLTHKRLLDARKAGAATGAPAAAEPRSSAPAALPSSNAASAMESSAPTSMAPTTHPHHRRPRPAVPSASTSESSTAAPAPASSASSSEVSSSSAAPSSAPQAESSASESLSAPASSLPSSSSASSGE